MPLPHLQRQQLVGLSPCGCQLAGARLLGFAILDRSRSGTFSGVFGSAAGGKRVFSVGRGSSRDFATNGAGAASGSGISSASGSACRGGAGAVAALQRAPLLLLLGQPLQLGAECGLGSSGFPQRVQRGRQLRRVRRGRRRALLSLQETPEAEAAAAG